MKNGRIDELERRLASANAELKASQEQSAAQINTIAAKEKELEVKSVMTFQAASESFRKLSSSLESLEALRW